MAKELRARGVEVTVLTGMPNYPIGRIFPGYRGKVTSREQVDGIAVHRVCLYPAAGRGSARRLLNYLSFTLTAGLRLLFMPRVDLVFVEAQPLILALPALVLKQLRGIPYVYNTPDLQVEIAEQAQWIGMRSAIRIAARLERWLMKRAITVTSVTQAFIDIASTFPMISGISAPSPPRVIATLTMICTPISSSTASQFAITLSIERRRTSPVVRAITAPRWSSPRKVRRC